MSNVVIYDTTFTVTRGELPHKWEIQGNEHYENFKAALRFLSSIGFYVSEDKGIKREYPTLNDMHRAGRYADLKFKAEWHQNDFKITFFQDVYHENSNGGFYDFDKLEKMPYLIKKQYELTQRKLIAYFENKGYTVSFGKNTKSEAAFIVENYIRSWHHPQNTTFELSEINAEYIERKRQLSLCSTAELKRELKRRESK